MSDAREAMTPYPTHSTPFPNALLDQVMPTLKDTEFRLLCVIVRATLGWRDPKSGQRKRVAWLSHSQIKARTGRSSEAVSHAIDVLVTRGYVIVTSEHGGVLHTAAERRRCSGGLFFEVPHSLWEEAGSEGTPTEQASPKSEVGTRKSEIRNPKTTKETENKNPPSGGRVTKPPIGENPVENSKRTPIQPANDVLRFLEAYRTLFQQKSTRGEPPPIHWARDGQTVKRLLSTYPYERLQDLLIHFFACEDAWIKRRGYSLAAFERWIPQRLVSDEAKGNRAPK
jgi:hypothetical protein